MPRCQLRTIVSNATNDSGLHPHLFNTWSRKGHPLTSPPLFFIPNFNQTLTRQRPSLPCKRSPSATRTLEEQGYRRRGGEDPAGLAARNDDGWTVALGGMDAKYGSCTLTHQRRRRRKGQKQRWVDSFAFCRAGERYGLHTLSRRPQCRSSSTGRGRLESITLGGAGAKN